MSACSAYECLRIFCCFFNDTATTEIYTLSLHDALPISAASAPSPASVAPMTSVRSRGSAAARDRKSTRLNSSHRCISYAVFGLKKKKRPLGAESGRRKDVEHPRRVAERAESSHRRDRLRQYLFYRRTPRPPRSTLFPFPTLFR